MTLTILLLVGLVLTVGSVFPWPIPFRRATVCNGHAELCGRLYSNVTVVGAHDSFAFSADPFALARDQEVNITTQLNLGVRLLQAQAHINEKDGTLHFCHTSCSLFDGGKVVDYLKIVKKFLDANPNEVLTLLFTNPEGLSVLDVWKPAFDASGITPLTYVPPSLPVKQSEWPTLGKLIESGKRVIVFLDSSTDTGLVNFILPKFQMIWETPFTVTNSSFPCKVDRIHGPLATEDHSYMINHSIMAHVNGCLPLGANRNPRFLLLDFVNIGEGFKAADILNASTPPQPSQLMGLLRKENQRQV
ncbi:hypothetical protein M413DRAFT_20602 [Hebeloma cylindrosporum]|uniref:Phosphatidylinositol-specific phospholipase C X domain-containing protein n=1 Tax=Hebeloma cylindrosporum TaxID=76867 RepID=A0A0C3BXX5_HEBCY|nr:hypothetical protein M413DRAFT_20602 [Hebeloma cylindrosporum h7]